MGGRDLKEGWLAGSTLFGSFGASVSLNSIGMQQLLAERAGDDIQVSFSGPCWSPTLGVLVQHEGFKINMTSMGAAVRRD